MEFRAAVYKGFRVSKSDLEAIIGKFKDTHSYFQFIRHHTIPINANTITGEIDFVYCLSEICDTYSVEEFVIDPALSCQEEELMDSFYEYFPERKGEEPNLFLVQEVV